ncbi:hypothetical protein KEM60_03252 [Austwickia sp. TVS 96-490-7B]|uniref:hypothetical protein n=1 Tax=Austwickia sp. TVS 96-490-7B TaxID=2830843 RepID=UPI001C590943|nr:hypothetical protein [Austwickia sp. TVS 96-490-7B]MBW3087022.1 hypothetical protein [Austwickia sp. TVS 96-490-7B]
MPVNAVFFSYLEDDGRRYLARSWLAQDRDGDAGSTSYGKTTKSKSAEWNGRDWFACFGEYPNGRVWEDGRRYGFISAGGGAWYTRTLRDVPEGSRINAYVPQRGYVGIGEVTGPAQRFDEARVSVDGREVALASLPLTGTYVHGADGEVESDEVAEWVLPVRWLASLPVEQAYSEKGLFANQNSACKLRQEFTLQRLAQRFAVPDEE